jgi:glycosyltransferase involved in cell wall biosynthesis
MAALPSYVLITPARNEAQLIELALQSVVAQSHPPVKWVIVSDGSTDGTDDIVQSYAARHAWIELVRMPEHRDRNFAAKVMAFHAGYERVKDLAYEVIGNLDADISFENDYFAFLMEKFAQNPRLGVAGTPFQEGDFRYDYRFVSIEHVSGACQLFRRACFEEIGGYTPVKGGGIDHIAVLTARMKGWQTRTFPEKVCQHHRQIGTAQRGVLKSKFKTGVQDYALGGHPLWELFRTVYQMKHRPYVAGGLMILGGYVWSWITRSPRPISREVVAFRRREQMGRLWRFFGVAKTGHRAASNHA